MIIINRMNMMQGLLKNAQTGPAPRIMCRLPERNANGIGLIICPGGGYGMLAEHEGPGYADYFSSQGFACFVLTYRLGSDGYKHPAMLEDALTAVGSVRAAAQDYGVDPQRLGIMGSSAGGHLAAHTLVAWNRYEADVSLRPDFGVLCYPVITSRGPHAHAGSMRNLAGDAAKDALLEELSCEKHVTEKTPSCFLWHTVEDATVPVENSLLFASALRQQGIPFELHVYPYGAHGLGLAAPFPWGEACVRWMHETTQQPTSLS